MTQFFEITLHLEAKNFEEAQEWENEVLDKNFDTDAQVKNIAKTVKPVKCEECARD